MVWEFTENVVEERVPQSRDTPASSSRESDPEPQRKVVSGKHSIHTHFPKDQNCEIRREDQDYKGSLQKTHWQSCTSSRKSW